MNSDEYKEISELQDFKVNVPNELAQLRHDLISKLEKFEEDDWIEFLHKLFCDPKADPFLFSVSPSLIEQLFWIYNTLSEKNKNARTLFTKSVLHLLKAHDPKTEEVPLLYELIYFIRETRPIEHRRLLQLIINEEAFKHLSFGSDNLHLLLIKSYTYIEDTQRLIIEEYVRSLVSTNVPYSLYIIVFYYSQTGHEDKALDFLSKFLKEREWTANKALCEEIYNAMSDCIPQYISLFKFLQRFINEDIKIEDSNIYLRKYINEFIEDLKESARNRGLVLFAEDVLKDKVENTKYSDEVRNLAETVEMRNLIIEHVARNEQTLTPSKEKEEQTVELNALIERTINESHYTATAGFRTF